MTVPTLTSVSPASGPTSGGDLVRLAGTGFAQQVAVHFGTAAATVLAVHDEAGASYADVWTPAGSPAVVDVTLRNLDAAGEPVPGEEIALAQAYRFLRPDVAKESDLNRLVRILLRELKRQILENTSITVSVEYDDTVTDDLNVVAISKLPSLVLTGPRVKENRFYSVNELREAAVQGPSGPELVRRRPPLTVDLEFALTAASDHTVELLNLMAAVAAFVSRNRWLEMPRDPDDSSAGTARWEMDPEGEVRTRLDGPDDVRVFTWGLVIRGFDIDEGLLLDRGKAVQAVQLEHGPFTQGGS